MFSTSLSVSRALPRTMAYAYLWWYLFGIKPKKKLVEGIVVIIHHHSLVLVLLLQLNQVVDVFLSLLRSSQLNVVPDDPKT
jgi:hypothetical protein